MALMKDHQEISNLNMERQNCKNKLSEMEKAGKENEQLLQKLEG